MEPQKRPREAQKGPGGGSGVPNGTSGEPREQTISPHWIKSLPRRPPRALEVLQITRQHGLELQVISYSAAIIACEKFAQWNERWSSCR